MNAKMKIIGKALLLGVCLFPGVTIHAQQHESAPTERKVVTIYEFKSQVPEVSPQSATDMFMTALVKTRTFAVLERQRLEESVYREKQLNQQGMTTGDVANYRLAGADYIFVGTVTEANATASRTGVGGSYKGLGLETSGEKAEIGLDIRVIDARTGAVLDAVNTRKKISEGGFSVSGIGSFLRSVTGKSVPGGDASITHDRKEGVDKALRECIEEAVNELARRWGR